MDHKRRRKNVKIIAKKYNRLMFIIFSFIFDSKTYFIFCLCIFFILKESIVESFCEKIFCCQTELMCGFFHFHHLMTILMLVIYKRSTIYILYSVFSIHQSYNVIVSGNMIKKQKKKFCNNNV